MKDFTTIILLLLSINVFGQTPCNVKNPSNVLIDGRQCSANNNWTVANDIVVPADTHMTLTAILPSIAMNPSVTVTSVLVKIYNDANGIPGTALNSQTIIPTSHTYKGSGSGLDFSDVLMDLTPFTLTGSAGAEIRYWVSIQVTTSNNTTAFMETTRATAVGEALAFSDGGPFIIADPLKDGVYIFFANCTPLDGGGFPYPYCGPLVFGKIEPITLVEVAGISNISSANLDVTPGHEDFVDIIGEMEQGKTYPITLGGNTDGAHNNSFVVFIDWNQNTVLDDEGEVYITEQLNGSTGTDGINITDNIVVPADAVVGTTRMRVKKTYNGPFTNPCASEATWGQVEDYSIEVIENSGVSVTENSISRFSYYPNPSSDIVYLKSDKNIESVSLYNLLGQEVINTKEISGSSNLDVSHLNDGMYILKVIINNKVGTYNFLKK